MQNMVWTVVVIIEGLFFAFFKSIEIILTSLKEKQYSKAQAVRLLKDELKLSLVDADRIVMNATAWSEEKEGNEAFREAFIDAITSGKSLDDVDGTDKGTISVTV